MELKKAQRKVAKMRVGLAGVSGSGKTMSALLLAFGMVGDWSKIAVIDTERGSASLYSDLGEYLTLPLDAPYTPERYIEAIHTCEGAGMEAIIIDSLSHEWSGTGGILSISENMTGNSYTNWAKITPRHNKFIDTILESPAHMICNMRSKQDYVLEEKNGKQVPRKVGMKAVTREDLEYEFTLVFDLDIKHNATCSKDRTRIFMDQPEFVITSNTGEKIMEWVNGGASLDIEKLKKELKGIKDRDSLMVLYQSYSDWKEDARLKELFAEKGKTFPKPEKTDAEKQAEVAATLNP